jgi:hypothetical protein
MNPGRSTLEGLEHCGDGRVAAWSRRAVLIVLALVLLVGVVSLLGVHTRHQHAEDGGYRLSLSYPAIARAGLDTKWQVVLEHPGGFTAKTVTLAVTGDYFDIFETQGFHPEPAGSTRDGTWLYLTFDTPPTGERLVVDFDAYIQPSSQLGRGATLEVLDAGEPVVSLDYTTWLLP